LRETPLPGDAAKFFRLPLVNGETTTGASG